MSDEETKDIRAWLLEKLLDFVKVTGTSTVLVCVFIWAGWDATVWIGNKVLLPISEQYIIQSKEIQRTQIELTELVKELHMNFAAYSKENNDMLKEMKRTDDEVVKLLNKIDQSINRQTIKCD